MPCEERGDAPSQSPLPLLLGPNCVLLHRWLVVVLLGWAGLAITAQISRAQDVRT